MAELLHLLHSARWPTLRAMNTTDSRRIRRRPADVEPADELAHYYTCPHCGQAVDRREFLQVVYHETQPGHEPLAKH